MLMLILAGIEAEALANISSDVTRKYFSWLSLWGRGSFCNGSAHKEASMRWNRNVVESSIHMMR